MKTNSKEIIKFVVTLIVRFFIHVTLIFLGSLMYCCSPYDEWGRVSDDFIFAAWFFGIVSVVPIIGAGVFYGLNWRKKWYLSITIDILIVLYIAYRFIVALLVGFGIYIPQDFILFIQCAK